jgi:aspartyl-tRNA(Asn)/glutamyl-tRNA(Gln) amidotransferase subunit A
MRQGDIRARARRIARAAEAIDPALRSLISLNPRLAEDAEALAARLERGGLPAAAGLAVSLKDNIDTAGWTTTMGSAFFRDHVPAKDAVVVERLKRAGALIVGKANLHEFAFGGTTQNPHHGLGRNPWNTDAIPGGSSGGSGASVAAGLCDVSLGTDTGGSIRIPAALNGVAGLRPTHGAVPNTGCFPVSDAHDTIGPLARTVSQVADVHEVIAGHDTDDPCCVDRPVTSWAREFARGVEGLRIGVPARWCFAGLESEVERLVRAAIEDLLCLGVHLCDVTLPGVEDTQKYLMPMVHADAAAHHAERLANAPGTFGVDVLERLRFGQRFDAPGYAESMRFKERWLRTLDDAFSDVDVLLMPTCPVTAPLHTDAARMLETTRELSRFTYAWAMAGTPALSVPCGFSVDGLPAAIQLVAPRWHDARVLALGAHYQQATTHHLRRPKWVEDTLARLAAEETA